MLWTESEAHPSVAAIAQSAYHQLTANANVDYRLLTELINEASGKGVLRAMHRKYSTTAHEAVLTPILREIDRQKPVPPRPRPDSDPLTASSW